MYITYSIRVTCRVHVWSGLRDPPASKFITDVKTAGGMYIAIYTVSYEHITVYEPIPHVYVLRKSNPVSIRA